ncbi:MAG: hypothetical protein ABW318_11710 [Vicinamibacterales bacterium]
MVGKLWHLEGRMDVGPWKTRANKVVAFVIRAPTADEARRLARDEAGGEDGYAWLEEKFSTCTELEAKGEAGVIIAAFIPPESGGFETTVSADTIRK